MSIGQADVSSLRTGTCKLFNKDVRLYKDNNKINDCNIILNSLKLSVKATRRFCFVLKTIGKGYLAFLFRPSI